MEGFIVAMVKSYILNNINHARIHSEILSSGYVSGFTGIVFEYGSLYVHGEILSSEQGLDALIAAHDPSPDLIIPNVTPRQIRTALFISLGLTESDIDAAINTLPSPNKEIAMIEWKQSNEFDRGRPLVTTMGAMLGKTSAELDALWLYAGTL